MIKRIAVMNYLDEYINLSLTNPEDSGFVVAGVSGLTPPKANINVADASQIDGGYLTSTHVGSRNIVLTLKFLPHKTIEECRLISYRIFPIKSNVTVIVETDNRLVQIAGVVEANEAEIFSSNCATRISIICPRPYFQQIGYGIASFGIVQPLFEFAFSNESLESPTIEISTETRTHSLNIVYSGDVDTGGLFALDFSGSCEDIVISDGRGTFMNIKTSMIETKTGTALGAGDRILINTIPGEKKITLVRNGISIPIFYCIDRYFEWMTIKPGNNTITYTARTGVDNIQIGVEYPIYYQGV